MERIDRYYSIGGLGIKVSGYRNHLYSDSGVLAPFEVSECECQRYLQTELTDYLEPPAGKCLFCDAGRRVYADGDSFVSYIGSVSATVDNAYMRIKRTGDVSEVQVRRTDERRYIGAKTILRAMELDNLLSQHNGFLLHSSYIIYNSEAILFTAVSGTGKSTQASLWEELRGAEIVNGDRAIVRRLDGCYYAFGVPFSGSSGISKPLSAPLKAVVCLKQAPCTSTEALSGAAAFRNIWEGCTMQIWNKPDVLRNMDTVTSLVTDVPVYQLACTPDESAVEALQKIMAKDS